MEGWPSVPITPYIVNSDFVLRSRISQYLSESLTSVRTRSCTVRAFRANAHLPHALRTPPPFLRARTLAAATASHLAHLAPFTLPASPATRALPRHTPHAARAARTHTSTPARTHLRLTHHARTPASITGDGCLASSMAVNGRVANGWFGVVGG